MSQNQKRSIGFWAGLVRHFRLAWRLLWDPRVPGWTKLVPFVSLLYLISPIDFLPDWFLGVGQLDDLGILLAGIRLFTALSPEEIVQQHLAALANDYCEDESFPLILALVENRLFTENEIKAFRELIDRLEDQTSVARSKRKKRSRRTRKKE